jgi:YHS domain-containing protein
MKSIKILSVAMLIIMFAVGSVLAEKNTVKQTEQKTCPVMGGEINKEIYADYEGKRIYFCCDGCIPEFQKDPAKYVKKLEDEGAICQDVPKAELKK